MLLRKVSYFLNIESKKRMPLNNNHFRNVGLAADGVYVFFIQLAAVKQKNVYRTVF